MATLVDHVRYNNLPSLEEANASLENSIGIKDVMNGPIRDAFLEYGVAETHCLYLQHRHHTMKATQAVVKVAGTAHLMDSHAMEDIFSVGNKIVPATWMVCDGDLHPMELAVVPEAATTPDLREPFRLKLLSILSSNNCGDLFGIDSIAKENWSELKIGDASVVIPSQDMDGHDHGDFIPVAFAFDTKDPKFRVHGKCKKDHKHTSK
ncbi:hypothetical protein GGR51DRAFT_559567 [Nemania sp. FL0031]|nr:hypothetical protein GGR51DRAFT_559567 [Nemania sp. FL0031]